MASPGPIPKVFLVRQAHNVPQNIPTKKNLVLRLKILFHFSLGHVNENTYFSLHLFYMKKCEEYLKSIHILNYKQFMSRNTKILSTMSQFPQYGIYLRPEALFSFEEKVTRTIFYLLVTADKAQWHPQWDGCIPWSASPAYLKHQKSNSYQEYSLLYYHGLNFKPRFWKEPKGMRNSAPIEFKYLLFLIIKHSTYFRCYCDASLPLTNHDDLFGWVMIMVGTQNLGEAFLVPGTDQGITVLTELLVWRSSLLSLILSQVVPATCLDCTGPSHYLHTITNPA